MEYKCLVQYYKYCITLLVYNPKNLLIKFPVTIYNSYP